MFFIEQGFASRQLAGLFLQANVKGQHVANGDRLDPRQCFTMSLHRIGNIIVHFLKVARH